MLKTIKVYEEDKKVLREILNEYERQIALKHSGKFPYTCEDFPGLSTSQKLTVLVEEVGELARAILNVNKLSHDETPDDAIEHLRIELVQVAAVTFSWLKGMK